MFVKKEFQTKANELKKELNLTRCQVYKKISKTIRL
jgi:hypothetical protein